MMDASADVCLFFYEIFLLGSSAVEAEKWLNRAKLRHAIVRY